MFCAIFVLEFIVHSFYGKINDIILNLIVGSYV